MRLLLVLAEVHALARQPVLALPYALSAWLQANELHLDVMVNCYPLFAQQQKQLPMR